MPLKRSNATLIRPVRKALDRYHRSYRHPSLGGLQLSGKYALFPAEDTFGAEHCWPANYPNWNWNGVYFVFDKDFELLYLGRATHLDTRLSDYFWWGERRSCRIVAPDSWSRPPAYVITVPASFPCEEVPLEAYLIKELQPSDNITGKKRSYVEQP
jgi:hypothetical protein